jgi:hypothetical protein
LAAVAALAAVAVLAGVARLAAGRADPTVGSATWVAVGTGVADAAVDLVARLDRVAGAAVGGSVSSFFAGAALLLAAAAFELAAFLPAAALLVAGLLVGSTRDSYLAEDGRLLAWRSRLATVPLVAGVDLHGRFPVPSKRHAQRS